MVRFKRMQTPAGRRVVAAVAASGLLAAGVVSTPAIGHAAVLEPNSTVTFTPVYGNGTCVPAGAAAPQIDVSFDLQSGEMIDSLLLDGRALPRNAETRAAIGTHEYTYRVFDGAGAEAVVTGSFEVVACADEPDPGEVIPAFPDTGAFVAATVVGASSYVNLGSGVSGYLVSTIWPGGMPRCLVGSDELAHNVAYRNASGQVVAPAQLAGSGQAAGAEWRSILIRAPRFTSPLTGAVHISCDPDAGASTVLADLPLRIDDAPDSPFNSPHQWSAAGARNSRTVVLRAMGFTAGERVHATLLNSSGTGVASVPTTADGAGAVSATIAMPSGYTTANGLDFVLAGTTSRYALYSRTAQRDLPTVDAAITTSQVADSSSPSGRSLQVNLSGYAAGSTVVVALHSAADPIELGTVTTDSRGAARATLHIPLGLSGTYRVWAGEKTKGFHLASSTILLMPQAEPTVRRLAGADRYATSAAISAASFDAGVSVAYIANGLNFPDALSGAPVAGVVGGPVLLATKDSLPTSVQAELRRLEPRSIVVLGGEGVISAGLETALEEYTTGAVTRLAGASRFDTSAAISAGSFTPRVPVAYVANGMNFPDALSGAPVAGIARGPVLLTSATTMPDALITELTRLRPRSIVVLGGAGVVSDDVAALLEGYTTGRVTRVSGGDRYATSTAISEASFDPGVPVAYVASGQAFPDALSGAPIAGIVGGPVLLTSPTALPATVKAELERLQPAKIVVLGGTGAVSERVLDELRGYTG